MASVTLNNVTKVFDGNVVAVDDFNLEIEDREFVVLVGPSGCGKSTTLRMIAGLELNTGGEIFIGDKPMNGVEPRKRNIAMVFQSYALYPHLTVYDNIAFGLKMHHVPKKEIDAKVREAAELLKISDLLKRKPGALSGGQRQRVAIGRAIVRSPDVFLMDEPLSNLDAKLRSEMRAELIRLRRRLDTTFVYVTHDQTEAMTLGDRIVVMDKGRIMQVGTPEEVFDRPANLFVAGFIGTPPMNFLPAELYPGENGPVLRIAETEIPLDAEVPALPESGLDVVLGIRPEHLSLGDGAGLPAEAEVTELMGSSASVHFRVGETRVEVLMPVETARAISPGERRTLQLQPDRIHLFDAETGERLGQTEDAAI